MPTSIILSLLSLLVAGLLAPRPRDAIVLPALLLLLLVVVVVVVLALLLLLLLLLLLPVPDAAAAAATNCALCQASSDRASAFFSASTATPLFLFSRMEGGRARRLLCETRLLLIEGGFVPTKSSLTVEVRNNSILFVNVFKCTRD
jgi:hypothetical protein